MAKSNFQVKGFEEVQKILDALPKTLGPKTVQKALKEGAKPLIAQTKENVPQDKGNLKRSIGAINARGSQRGAGIYVGPKRGKAKNAQGWHAHLVEYGTGPRKAKGKILAGGGEFFGKEVGPMSAQPFLRPAWESTNGQVQIEIKKSLQEVLRSNFKGVKF